MILLSQKSVGFLAVASQSFSTLSATLSNPHIRDLESVNSITTRDDFVSIKEPLRTKYGYAGAYKRAISLWYIVDHSGADSAARLQVLATSKEPPPLNSDPAQGTSFQVDHILELQFVCKPFDSTVPQGNIAPTAWSAARDALCLGGKKGCKNIAKILGRLSNLAGLPQKVHSFKTEISNDLGRAGASISSFANELNNEPGFTPNGDTPAWIAYAIKAYLLQHKDEVMALIHDVAVELGHATNEDAHIYAYATGNMQEFVNNAPDAIDQWLYKFRNVALPGSSSATGGQSTPAPAPKCALQ